MGKLLSSRSVQTLIEPLLGKLCCRKQVGYRESLSIGFGSKIPHQNRLKSRDDYYGEWEIGTYNSAWRVIHRGKILCGSHDIVDSIKEHDAAFNRIELRRLVSVQQLTDMDIRLVFDLGITIDFLATTRDEDEWFHIFCHQGKYIEFTVGKGCTIGPSNTPWHNKM